MHQDLGGLNNFLHCKQYPGGHTAQAYTGTQSTFVVVNVYKKPPATAEELQVIRFTGAVSPCPSVCPATAWAWMTAACCCCRLL